MNAPREVLSKARALCDDPLFVHRVGIATTRYRDDQAALLTLPQTREELKAPHKRIIEAAQAYRVVARECGVPEDSTDMLAAGARVTVSKSMLRDIEAEGRFDRNVELESLCRRLLEIFTTYNVGAHKVTAFVASIIELISPDRPPSRETIKKAVSYARKTEA